MDERDGNLLTSMLADAAMPFANSYCLYADINAPIHTRTISTNMINSSAEAQPGVLACALTALVALTCTELAEQDGATTVVDVVPPTVVVARLAWYPVLINACASVTTVDDIFNAPVASKQR